MTWPEVAQTVTRRAVGSWTDRHGGGNIVVQEVEDGVSESTRPADGADIRLSRNIPRGVREQHGRHDEGRSPAVRCVCFAQNTRDEVRIVQGGVCGALAAQPGMKQQNYVLVAGRVD